jgi:phenylacetate 2-hydroxylase
MAHSSLSAPVTTTMDHILAYLLHSAFSLAALFAVAIIILTLLYVQFFYVDIPIIAGISEIPGGDILAGHLYKLGEDHATTAEAWAQKYDWPVFQLRMGYRRAIMINSFEAAREWFVKNQSSTLDRPLFYTYHKVVSSTSGTCRLFCKLEMEIL